MPRPYPKEFKQGAISSSAKRPCEACRWARDAGEMVTIATSDSDFAKTIKLFPEFGTYVNVLDVTA